MNTSSQPSSAQTIPTSAHLTGERFQSEQIIPIVGAHLIHDIYSACVAPLLPEFIQKLSLSLTQAGSLTAIMNLPALLNPFIGYLADRISVRYFIILAPAVTATLISLIGLAPSYGVMLVMLFIAGVSVAAFHAPSPAMIGRVAGRQVGLGMSLYMAGGEIGFTLGPLLAVWAASTWTLSGMWRIMVFGWLASAILFWRLRGVAARPEKPGSLRVIFPRLVSLYIPLAMVNLFRFPMLESLSTYLPTYMTMRGAGLFLAGSTLSIVQLAGVGGALSSGLLSDRLDRKRVLLVASAVSSMLMLVFLRVEGWLSVVMLIAVGFSGLALTPVMMAIVQDSFPQNRSVANGLYMVIAFLLRPAGTLLIGALGDRLGLRAAMHWGALISFLAIPFILVLPGKMKPIKALGDPGE